MRIFCVSYPTLSPSRFLPDPIRFFQLLPPGGSSPSRLLYAVVCAPGGKPPGAYPPLRRSLVPPDPASSPDRPRGRGSVPFLNSQCKYLSSFCKAMAEKRFPSSAPVHSSFKISSFFSKKHHLPSCVFRKILIYCVHTSVKLSDCGFTIPCCPGMTCPFRAASRSKARDRNPAARPRRFYQPLRVGPLRKGRPERPLRVGIPPTGNL